MILTNTNKKSFEKKKCCRVHTGQGRVAIQDLDRRKKTIDQN